MPKIRPVLGLLASLLLLVAALPLLRPSAPVRVQSAAAQYVGAAACAGCHQAQTSAWRRSQHALAMQEANAQTVLGNFENAQFKDGRTVSSFLRRDGAYFVRTDGPDGRLAEFPVRYTFGVYPLQQYLVPFPDGRLQALPIAWDARPAAQGGQRWFHLYAGQGLDHRDPLHWTRLEQNWNFMCASCHSTNLERGYDGAHDTYASRWSDLNVACESCHGAGSRHLSWAQLTPAARAADASKGLSIALDERRAVHWQLDPATGNSTRSVPLHTHREIETCANCHARGATLGAQAPAVGHLFDAFDPALLRAGLYFPDGQQDGEVYVYGSFLQSKMYAKGVSCSDCHEPHSMQLRAPGNAVCAQCHSAAKFDTPAHHLHASGSAGAQCADCHMPKRVYMSVDERRDHSLRVPRPDLSLRHGVPNACNNCHRDRDAAWAAAVIEQHYGPQRKGYQHFVQALADARLGVPGAAAQLRTLAADGSSPDIARATALAELAAYPSRATLSSLQAALRDANPMMRAAALESLLAFAPEQRAAAALPLVDDATRLVRIKAGRALADVPDALLTSAQRQMRERAFGQYRQAQEELAERPEAHLNLGSVYALRGDAPQAAAQYQTALKLDPDFVPAYLHLADLYRAQHREDQVSAVLTQGLQRQPGNAALLHLSGLQRVRQGQLDQALALLGQAAGAAPGEAHYAYVYAVALHEAGRAPAALRVLSLALQASPYSPELLQAASAFAERRGSRELALQYRRRYEALQAESGP